MQTTGLIVAGYLGFAVATAVLWILLAVWQIWSRGVAAPLLDLAVSAISSSDKERGREPSRAADPVA
jgi:hypothetical protein